VVCTQWTELTNLIVKQNDLQILLPHSLSRGGRNTGYGLQQLCLDLPTEFPHLRELGLSNFYEAGPSHVPRMIETIYWSSLCRLDLGTGPLGYLVQSLTGLIPQLKALVVRFTFALGKRLTEISPDTDTMQNFIKSITGLQEFTMTTKRSRLGEAIWPVVLYSHGHSLKKLAVRWEGEDKTIGLQNKDLQVLIAEARELREISLELAMIAGAGDLDGMVSISVSIRP
jgi:hypothetical protein